MSEQLKFFKGNQSNLTNIVPESGAIYHCEDTGNTYIGKESGLDVFSLGLSYSEDGEEVGTGEIVLKNADTLGGYPASFYTTKTEVSEALTYAVSNVPRISGVESKVTTIPVDADTLGGFDANHFVTKSQLDIIEAQVTYTAMMTDTLLEV